MCVLGAVFLVFVELAHLQAEASGFGAVCIRLAVLHTRPTWIGTIAADLGLATLIVGAANALSRASMFRSIAARLVYFLMAIQEVFAIEAQATGAARVPRVPIMAILVLQESSTGAIAAIAPAGKSCGL